MTQSLAIMRHLARQHNLIGESEAEIARVDMAEQEVNDFRAGFVSLCYNPKFVSLIYYLISNHVHVTHKEFFITQEELKVPYLEALPKKLESFSKFLGDGKWLAGDKVGC